MPVRMLDLFAGIGGFSLAASAHGVEVAGQVEIDPWCRRVLAKHWPDVPKAADVKEVRGDEFGPIDLVCGGYPCQPFSLAGKRQGAADDRHLWPHMRRVIDRARPRYVLAENVYGHVTMGLDVVLSDLEADGYACGAVVVPAGAVNALHRRDRVWIMAHATESGSEARRPEQGAVGPIQPGRFQVAGLRGEGTSVADAAARGLRRGRPPGHAGQPPRGGEVLGHPLRHGGAAGLAGPDAGQEGHAGIALDAGDEADVSGTAGPEVARQVDPQFDGLPAGLVRRPAAGPAWDPDVIRAAWTDGTWERDLPRVVADEPERRQKLQAAGNAIVPVLAYTLLGFMLYGEDW